MINGGEQESWEGGSGNLEKEKKIRKIEIK